jgi:hypothetical protein
MVLLPSMEEFLNMSRHEVDMELEKELAGDGSTKEKR